MSEISIPCWAQRYEVDPRYDYRADTFVYDAPGLAPGCGHENCLAELARHKTSTAAQDNCTGQTMWDCPITACRYYTINASCDLDDGHEGDHTFVASSDVVLEFGPSPLPPMACTCKHAESDHSTQHQIELGYPTGCTAIVEDSPDPRVLELCGCTFGPAPLLRGDAVPLPGFESVEAAPDQRSRPWTA